MKRSGSLTGRPDGTPPRDKRGVAESQDLGYDEFNSDLPPDLYPEGDYTDLNADLREPVRGADRRGKTAGDGDAGKRKDYLKKSLNQIVLGNYTDDVTALGTLGQIALGLTGVDTPADIRDLAYDLTNWEWSPGHAGQTLLDAVGLIPGIGVLKNADEVAAVLKGVFGNADAAATTIKGILKNADEAGAVLKGTVKNADEAGTALKSVMGSTDEAAAPLKGISRNADEAAGLVSSSRKAANAAEGMGETARAVAGEPDEMDKAIDAFWNSGDITSNAVTEGAGETTLADWADNIKELAKTSPLKIPDNATIKSGTKAAGYDQISYKWPDSGYNYEARWHTKTPGAPAGQGNTWVITRVTPGTATGNSRTVHILAGDKWVTRYEWQAAINAYQNGAMTAAQEAMLKAGHWLAP